MQYIPLGELHAFDPQMHVGALFTASFVLLQIGWQLVEACARLDLPVPQDLQFDWSFWFWYWPWMQWRQAVLLEFM
jgi:hypothetical protein